MKSFFLSSFCAVLALGLSAEAQVQTQLGDVQDSRTTGQFFGGLKVQIKLFGDIVGDVKSMRANVNTAVDDTGRDLVNHEKQDVEFKCYNINGGQNYWELNLKNPARKAGTIKEISGEFELFTPKNDPDCVVKVNDFKKAGGKPIESPVLATARIEVTTYTQAQRDAWKASKKEGNIGDALSEAFGSMFGGKSGPNDITVQIKDPAKKIIQIEFQDADGKKIRENGWSGRTIEETLLRTYHFNSELPETSRLVMQVITPKSVIKAPFALKDIFLP